MAGNMALSSAERSELTMLRGNIADLNNALQRSREELIQIRTEVPWVLYVGEITTNFCCLMSQNERLRNDMVTVRNNYDSLEHRYMERQRRVQELENEIMMGGGGGGRFQLSVFFPLFTHISSLTQFSTYRLTTFAWR